MHLDFRTALILSKNIITSAKISILLVLLAFLCYFITLDLEYFNYLAYIGFCYLIYAGIMSTGYSSGYDQRAAYIKPEYNESVIWSARTRYLSSGVILAIKGVILLTIGAFFYLILK